MRFLFFVTITFLAVNSTYAQIETAEICNQMEFVNKLVKNPYKVDSIIKSSTFYDRKVGYKLSGFKEDNVKFKEYFPLLAKNCKLFIVYPTYTAPKLLKGKVVEEPKLIYAYVLQYYGKDKNISNRFVTFEFIQNDITWCINSIYLGTTMYVGINPEDFIPPQTRAKKYGEE